MVVGAGARSGGGSARDRHVKVLVTGRSGQLARSLLSREQQPGLQLVALGRPELDLEVPGSAAEATVRIRPDVIVNTAAYTAVDQAEDEPARAFRINAEGAGELARAAADCGARLIQVSTDYVFDGRSAAPYRPSDRTGPLNVYGRSKLAGEEQVRAALPGHLIIRTAWLLSPFGTNFLRTMLGLAEQHATVRVVADQSGSPTSALDLADGLLAILRCWQNDCSLGLGETYHLAGAGSASWAELAGTIFHEAGRRGLPTAVVQPIPACERPSGAERPARSSLDSSDLERRFGISAKPWRSAIPALVAAISAEPRRSDLR